MTHHQDISVVAVFHGEKAYCLPALASLRDLASTAAADGLSVETIVMLDAPDSETRRLVVTAAKGLSKIEEVSFGDLGLTRNHAAELAQGHYLSFLDGDDLWGAEWLSRAYRAATDPGAPLNAIWHPQVMYLFTEADFDHSSFDCAPHPQVQAVYLIQESSNSACFDPRALFMENMWGAVAFARRAVFRQYPYLAVDRAAGFGIEDWSWNSETLAAGFVHRVVEGTVHLHREKAAGGLGVQNLRDGLLPFTPVDAKEFRRAAAFAGQTKAAALAAAER
jgi:hypothetical protein